MREVKRKVWVVTAWLKDVDEDGEPINWSSPSEEHFASTYEEALELKEQLLENSDYEDVWIGDEAEEREFLE